MDEKEKPGISPAEFKRMLDKGEVQLILDLREKDEFRSWPVEGRVRVDAMNIPRYQFVGEEEKYLDMLPRGRRIVAVCAHGDSSKYSAGLLRESGFDAVSLEGGMDAWSEFYETTEVAGAPGVYQIFRAARGCISHLVAVGGEAAVIDAPRHIRHALDLAKKLNVKITRVLDTHLHADHISGGRELAAATNAAYFVHPADMEGATYPYEPMADGQVIKVGGSSIKVVHSPGHTPGSTSLLLDGAVLFTGDTIMKGSIGRPDLGGRAPEWAVLLHKTLFTRFAALPDETVVLPSHAASMAEEGSDLVIRTTLGEARRSLDLFRIRDLSLFVSAVESNLPENPERYQEIRKVNLGLRGADEAGKKELEIGKNLCGMAK